MNLNSRRNQTSMAMQSNIKQRNCFHAPSKLNTPITFRNSHSRDNGKLTSLFESIAVVRMNCHHHQYNRTESNNVNKEKQNSYTRKESPQCHTTAAYFCLVAFLKSYVTRFANIKILLCTVNCSKTRKKWFGK